MSTTAATQAGAPSERKSVLRFDGVQRAAHWSTTTLFAVLVLTALPLYFGSVERLVGRHILMADIHLWVGVAFPLPLLVSVAGPWGRRMRQDVRRMDRWTVDEIRWIRSLGRARTRGDKFNPGQKLNGIFVTGAMTLMLVSGVLMRWFGLVPVSWRTGATFVHAVLAWVFVIVIAGHVVMALTHPEALTSMLRGRVGRDWAERHAPAWLSEEDG